MSAVAAAIIGGAAITGVVGAISSSNASRAQERAANAQAQAQRDAAAESAALQREMFNKQVELQAPFREAGLTSQNKLMTLLGLDGGDRASGEFGMSNRPFSQAQFEADPGYGFRLSEGIKALDRSASSRGGLLSGAGQRGAIRFGQDAASQEYQNAFNRYQAERQARLNPLQSLLGGGQTSANALTSAAGQTGQGLAANATNLGNGLATAYGNAGSARASGYVGMGNALSNAISGGINNYAAYNMFGGGGGGYGNQMAAVTDLPSSMGSGTGGWY